MIRFIKDLFVRNWGLKLFSLILALFVWITYIREDKSFSEKTLTIPLETRNIPADMELVEKPVSVVDVTVRAPDRIIDQITAANVFAKLNMERASVYQLEYPLNSSMISLPYGAEVKKISPNTVHLKLERGKEISLDVEPYLIGKPNEELQITKIDVVPSKVLVRGPESKVKDKDKVHTSPIDISSFPAGVSEVEADLILPKPDLRLVTSLTRVKVRFLVQEKKNVTSPVPKQIS